MGHVVWHSTTRKRHQLPSVSTFFTLKRTFILITTLTTQGLGQLRPTPSDVKMGEDLVDVDAMLEAAFEKKGGETNGQINGDAVQRSQADVKDKKSDVDKIKREIVGRSQTKT